MSDNSDLKYLVKLKLENVRCFGSERKLDLTDENGNISQWTLIFGDNGVGKTTLLQCLAWMLPEFAHGDAWLIPPESEVSHKKNKTKKYNKVSSDIILVPTLQSEDNSIFKTILKLNKNKINLRAEICVGQELYKEENFEAEQQHRDDSSENIITEINASFLDDGKLDQKKTFWRGSKKIYKNALDNYKLPFIIAYGANRYKGRENLSNSVLKDPITSRLTGNTELYDPEEILQDMYFAVLDNEKRKDEIEDKIIKANQRILESFKEMLVQILPEIETETDIKIYSKALTENTSYPTGVRFKTYSGDVPLSSMSLGYQTTLAWVLDLAWRLYQHYPISDNPLAEPAIVLIDEIDLHLHPKWQYTIMDDLSKKFTSTQFIATTHSPLMAMSNSAANLAVVRKQDDEVVIENEPNFVKSWRVDQILTSELFDFGKTRHKDIEKNIQRKYELLDKQKRTTEDENELQEINDLILQLPTTNTRGDFQKPDLVTRAANILKKYRQND